MPSSPRKGSPKKSPQKGGKSSPGKSGKLSSQELEELERKYFARKRYDVMDAVFTQKGRVINIYTRNIHLYEIWNKLPSYEQFCNSNINTSNKKSPKSKSSPKKSPKGGRSKSPPKEEGPPKPEYERAILTGIISAHKSHLQDGYKLFAEITAEFRYFGYAKVPPYPDNVAAKCQCYRDVTVLYPIDFDKETEFSPYTQQLIYKLRSTLGRGYRMFPFTFDVTRKPDSIFFNRPYYPEFTGGLFWKLKAYIAQEENCAPLPEKETTMEFFKYTISPALIPSEIPAVEYVRYSTREDTGDLILKGQLDKNIYYHGQDIKVKIQVENNSSRHVVIGMAVFVEQTYKLYHQFPHDCSIPLGEVILQAGDQGLPINPKSKNWSKEVTLKPAFDQTKYNLAIDGKMVVDDKVFLASSTIIMLANQVPVVAEEEAAEGRPKSPKGSPKKNSPKGKTSPKEKSPKGKSSPKDKKSPKGSQSPAKSGNQSPPKVEEPPPDEEVKQKIVEINTITNRQACRSIFIAYDVVIRLNLKTPQGDESGHPMIRLPFILTRETRFLDKFANPPPPTWGKIIPH
ncbi:unnamed protein product [Calicophoron daubneyi]|uniref:Arrestin C-terminal-like domain-containing protein n=1 Tax=Calicophoron daubneyi TaxID=300641 RepID=A0AAV2TE17_CALDB